MSDSSRSSGGLFGLLGIVFIVLKLTGTISWSWWLVTLPLWGGFALMIAILIVLGIFAAIIALLE